MDSKHNPQRQYRCQNCRLGFATQRSMNSHYNHCILEEDVPNMYMRSYYSAAEFNQQVNRGHITPHHMHFGFAYNMQLQDVSPIAQQASQNVDVDHHNDAMFDDVSLPPPLIRDGEYDDVPSSDDEEDEEDEKSELPPPLSPYREYNSADDEDFGKDDCSNVTADDMNLDDDMFVSEFALPSIFNDVTMLYDSKKHLIPPEESKPNARKQPLGHMTSQNFAMSQLLILVNKHGVPPLASSRTASSSGGSPLLTLASLPLLA
jgi:hypothetical protein